MKHEKRSGVLTLAKETVKFHPKSLASSAAALRHGPASALGIANIREADRGNITGVWLWDHSLPVKLARLDFGDLTPSECMHACMRAIMEVKPYCVPPVRAWCCAGVAKATAALVQAGLVKLCADTTENVAISRKRLDVATALNIELERIGRADAAAAVSAKLCTTGR